ncbi:MAG: hypothetical protein IJU05_06365 [Schwartzia sp.]|nr:hypothetical protein [Schwartzia sp. (in: firmicutes)]
MNRLEMHMEKRNKKKKWFFRAMAVGVFVDEKRTTWSEDTRAYGSVKDFIADVGEEGIYYERLAEDLHVKPEELGEYLEAHDGVLEMCTLIRSLLTSHSNIAVKGFQKYRDAESFLSLLDQLGYEIPPDPETEALAADAEVNPRWLEKRQQSLFHYRWVKSPISRSRKK